MHYNDSKLTNALTSRLRNQVHESNNHWFCEVDFSEDYTSRPGVGIQTQSGFLRDSEKVLIHVLGNLKKKDFFVKIFVKFSGRTRQSTEFAKKSVLRAVC